LAVEVNFQLAPEYETNVTLLASVMFNKLGCEFDQTYLSLPVAEYIESSTGR